MILRLEQKEKAGLLPCLQIPRQTLKPHLIFWRRFQHGGGV
jgi:hypothetical protein